MNDHSLVLRVKGPNGFESRVHVLNPGETFERFGGNKSGLTVGKTASIIVSDCTDTYTVQEEKEIYDAKFWAWIAALINACDGCYVAESSAPGASGQ